MHRLYPKFGTSTSNPLWLQLSSRFGEIYRTNSDVKQDQETRNPIFLVPAIVSTFVFSAGKLFPFSHDAEDEQTRRRHEEQHCCFERTNVVVCDPCPLIFSGLQKNFEDDHRIRFVGESPNLRALRQKIAAGGGGIWVG